MPMEGTPEEQAIKTGRPVLVRSVAEFVRFPSSWVAYSIDHGVKSGCFNPLIAHGRTLGALGVVSLREDAFTPEAAKLLEEISGQIAIAVENALNFEKTRQAEQVAKHERDRSKLLLDINNALVSHLDLSELVRAISSSLQPVVPNECVALAIYDSETGKLFAQAVSSVISPMPEGIYYDPEGTTSGVTFKSGRPLYLPRPDYENFPSPVTHGFFKSGLKSLYSMPITIHGRKLGVMSISSVREDAFSKDDQELFQQIANQVAIAAANALAVRDLEALKNKLAQEKLYLEDEIRNELNFDEIVGQSPALKQVLKLVETVAASDSTVLLLGETGTGKELIARAVHEHSRRKSRTFVKLNCAAIPTGLLESELFGHEKGAFTGAIAQKIGRLELADQGTLFLDEVGDIPVEIQPKLLRALQEREFERLGSTHTKKVNVRLVAATNRDLEKMIEERQFRGRPLLPAECVPDPHSSVARTTGGHSSAGPLFRWEICSPDAEADRFHPDGNDEQTPKMALAREHPRTGESDRESGHSDHRNRVTGAIAGYQALRGKRCSVFIFACTEDDDREQLIRVFVRQEACLVVLRVRQQGSA